MKIVTVIPLAKGVFKEDLTYFTAKEIYLGSIVEVSIRNRKILAMVINIEELSSTKTNIKDLNFSLKKIENVKDNSIFKREYLDSALLLSKYFVAKKNVSIAALIPTVLIQEYDKISKIKINSIQTEEKNTNIKTEKLLFQTSLDDRLSYYKTLVRGSFAQKKSVFIVFPTEHDIDIFKENLSKGIEDFIFSLHGNLNPKKQLETYKNIINQNHPILVLGTAPYLSIPRSDFETIVLEHENSNAYKMIAPPHFDLRIFVEIYASKIGAKFILADTQLRYETLTRKDTDNFSEVYPLSFRNNYNGEITVIDRKKDDTEKKFEIFSEKIINEIKYHIERKEKVFIFSLRKGLATITICRDCGETLMCKNCSAPLVLYLSKNDQKRMFVCNRCQNTADPKTTCENCNSWNLTPYGIGVDTVYAEIKKLFPYINIFQLDKESAKNAKGAEKIIKDFSKEENTGQIMIGTEMAVLYLKDKVALSIIASFDSLWGIPSFRMGEKVVQLLSSILSKTDKKLYIQTKNAKDKAITSFQTENLLSFAREELKDRKNLGYPPYKRFIKITHLGDKEDTIKTKQALAEVFKDYDPLIFSGFVAKQKDKYMTNTLLKLEPTHWSLPELSTGGKINETLLEKLRHLPTDFLINIDPEDLL